MLTNASPIACEPEAHAEAGAQLAPRRLRRMATSPGAMLPMTAGTP
jgi:hypothetical protein